MNDVVPPAAAESAAAGVSRIALGIEYKGSRYRGWQRQEAGVPSVQEALAEVEKDITALRESAGTKESEVISAVISALV